RTTARTGNTQRVTTGPIAVDTQKNWVARGAAVVLASAGVLTFIGFITSISYNSPLGLVGQYATESAIWWPVWGVRSLIAVFGGMVLLSLGFLTITGVWRLAYSTIGPLRRSCDPLIGTIQGLIEPLGRSPTATLASGLLLTQLVAIGLLLWRFHAILNGLDSFLTKRSSDDLWALGPVNRGDHNLLVQLLSADLL